MFIKLCRLSILINVFICSFNVFSSERNLIWNDEFNYNGLPNSAKWSYEEGYIRNGEVQRYNKENKTNSRVENGHLIIEAHHKPTQREQNLWQSLFEEQPKDTYTSASLTTKHLPGWSHGRVEVRAKLPQGRGLWPAIWLLGSNIKDVGWPMAGEIDIMEYVGFKPDIIHSAIHTGERNYRKNNHAKSYQRADDLSHDFHVYSVERSLDRIDFYIDEVLHYSYQKEGSSVSYWPFDKPMYLIINLAVGGSWGGQKGIDNSIFPQKFIIDYVRVYE